MRIADGLSQTLETMRGLIGSLHATAAAVAVASGQIQSATEQSAQVTQEGAGTIQQVAAEAQASRQAAARVMEIATTGRTTVEETIAAMGRSTISVNDAGASIGNMRELSKRIGAIVQAIDEIADQTNMLALSAAIEAARAGEHGLGFAVVAEEVRKLADHCRQATREIDGLISDVQGGIEAAGQAMEGSAGQVASGTQLAGEAGGALANIAQAAAASNQQALQIAEGATGVASTTEAMSAQIEELTASAQMLAHLSTPSPFGIAWSDVPTGSETTCPAAAMLGVTLPGDFAELRDHANRFRIEASADGAKAPVRLRRRALAA